MLTESVYQYIRKWNMIPEGSAVVCGVSGGADSTALLLILAELRQRMSFTLEAVHVEHGIRGEESRQDMAFTEELCKKLQIPCRFYPVNVPEYAAENHLGTEEAARLLRYRIFARRAAETGGRVALAHHRNDQAETVLFSMIRGSGIRGLGGMEPVRQATDGTIYIRPLLAVDRKDIEAYLDQKQQTYCTDGTNSDTAYSRNRIRNLVIPQLELINEQALLHITEAADMMRETENYLAAQTREAYRNCRAEEKHPGGENCRAEEKLYPYRETQVLDIEKLTGLPPLIRRRVLMLALRQACGHSKDLEAVHVESLEHLLCGQSGKRIDLPYGVLAVRNFQFLMLISTAAGREPARQEETIRSGRQQTGGEETGESRRKAQQLPGEGEAGRNSGTQLPAGPDKNVRSRGIDRNSGKQTAARPEGNAGRGGNVQQPARMQAQEISSGQLEALPEGGILQIPLPKGCLTLKKQVFSGNFPEIPKNQYTKWFDYAKIKNGFSVRYRQSGDFLVIDQAGHRQKLKAYLIGAKVPATERDNLFLLADAKVPGAVIWVPGGRISEAYKVTEETEYILEIQYTGE